MEAGDEERKRLSTLSDAEREAHFAQVVRAAEPKGAITTWNND